jgi:multicomponent Na+:H+ antiporter subunit G
LIVVGSVFSLLAAIGVLRFPDVYLRIQSMTKSSTLGTSCLVVAAMIYLADTGTSFRASLIVAFLFVTAPVAAHVIARAAYAAQVPMWDRTHVNEMPSAERLPEHQITADVDPAHHAPRE